MDVWGSISLRIQIPPDRIGLRVPIPSEKNRNVGVIPFLGHTWILRVLHIENCQRVVFWAIWPLDYWAECRTRALTWPTRTFNPKKTVNLWNDHDIYIYISIYTWQSFLNTEYSRVIFARLTCMLCKYIYYIYNIYIYYIYIYIICIILYLHSILQCISTMTFIHAYH